MPEKRMRCRWCGHVKAVRHAGGDVVRVTYFVCERCGRPNGRTDS